MVRSMRSNAKRRTVEAPVRERNRIGPYTIYSETVELQGVEFFQITIRGKHLLPDPLAIASPGAPFPARAERPALPLHPRQFTSLNRLAGRTVFARETEELITRLWRLCHACLIEGDSIRVLIANDQNGPRNVPEINNILPRLGDRLAATSRSFDIRINDAYLTVRESDVPEDRLIALSILIEFYSKHRWTKELLPELVKAPDFDLACLAAKGLGMDTERFAFSRIESSDRGNQIKAVRYIRQERRFTGLDFLLQYYPRAEDPEVRREIVLAFKHFADPRAEKELLRTVGAAEGELVLAALDALVVCGGQAALEPLYALARERSRPRSLRDAAKAAGDAIRKRLGLGRTDAGRLSLARKAGDAGELSLTAAPGNGRVNRSENDQEMSGESDE
jgi:hypothetical protein